MTARGTQRRAPAAGTTGAQGSSGNGAIVRRSEAAGNQLASLEEYARQANRYNVLHPVSQLAETVRSSALVESVSIVVPDPETGKGHLDYYKPSFATGGDLAPTSHLLQKIANAAGIRMEPVQILERDRDPVHGGITVSVTGYVRQPNGEWIGWSKGKEIDLTVEADKERKAWIKRWEEGTAKSPGHGKGAPYDTAVLEEYVRGRLMQIREHLLALAETKAQSRVIRTLLALPQMIPANRAGLPFVVPRLVGRPDLADPLLRDQAEREAEARMREAFGPSTVEVGRARGSEGVAVSAGEKVAEGSGATVRGSEGDPGDEATSAPQGKAGAGQADEEPAPADPDDEHEPELSPHSFVGDPDHLCLAVVDGLVCGYPVQDEIHRSHAARGKQGTLA